MLLVDLFVDFLLLDTMSLRACAEKSYILLGTSTASVLLVGQCFSLTFVDFGVSKNHELRQTDLQHVS